MLLVLTTHRTISSGLKLITYKMTRLRESKFTKFAWKFMRRGQQLWMLKLRTYRKRGDVMSLLPGLGRANRLP
jgi:hypothetical protein